MAEQIDKHGDVAAQTKAENRADGKADRRIHMDVAEGMETGMRGGLASTLRATPGERELCEKVLSVLQAGAQKLADIARALGVPPGWVEDAILALEGDGLVETTGVPGPLSGISAVLTDSGRRLVERTRFKDAEDRASTEGEGEHG